MAGSILHEDGALTSQPMPVTIPPALRGILVQDSLEVFG